MAINSIIIESPKNEIIKSAKLLLQSKYRKERNMHIIEGDRLVRDAFLSNAKIHELFIESGFENEYQDIVCDKRYIVSRKVIESLSDTQNPQHIIATVYTEQNYTHADGIIVALDCVQDPGNMGTIIRTADALGAKAVYISELSCDAFSPKCLRSSMGSIYHIPVIKCSLINELIRLRDMGYTLICGHLDGGYDFPSFNKNAVIVIGNEGNGVSNEIASLCHKFRIKMDGKAESLNASIAAALLIYEATRKI